jgi:protein TonB
VSSAKAYGFSAFLHVGAIGILSVSTTLEFQEPTRFQGQRHVIHAEWAAPPVPEIPPPLPFDPSPVSERVVIMPQRAELEQHRLIDTPGRDVPQSELLPMLDLPATFVVPPPPASLARSVESDSRDQPHVPASQPLPRERTVSESQRPVTASAASVPPPVSLGTDATTAASFANNAPPRYPEQARRNGWEGTVLLELNVAENGAVVDVRVVESSGYAVLDAAAVTAIRQWKGQPARRNGQPVTTHERLPVRFRL